MKKIIPLIVVTTIIVCYNAACKKEEKRAPVIEVKFDPEGLAWLQIPLNKYFIYKDSATGVLDSVVVTKSNLERRLNPKHVSLGLFDPNVPEYYYENFTLTLTSYMFTQTWFSGEASSNIFFSGFTGPSYLLLFSENTNNSLNYAFVYPFGSSGFATMLSYATISIEGKTYTNAIAYEANNGYASTDARYLKNINVWVKGVGIIKKTTESNSSIKTYLLVRNG
jgi:hypothetical protein